MLDSALVETLTHLRETEIPRLDKFIASPFFNDGAYARDVQALWNFLHRAAPGFSQADLTVENAYADLYPGKVFVKGKIEVLMSKLHQLVKQFAGYHTNTSFNHPESLKLATFYLDRGLTHRAEPLLKKLRETYDAQNIHDFPYWATVFELEWQTHRLDTLQQNNHNYESLSASMHALHHGYLVLMLQSLNNILFSSRKSRVDTALATQIAEGIPAAAAIANLSAEPMLRLLYRGFQMVRNPEVFDQPALHALLAELEKYADSFSPEALRTLHTYLRNHCTWQFNHGESGYASLLLKLYKIGLEKQFLLEKGHIQASAMLNMVQSGLVNKDFDWVKTVLVQLKDRIIGVPNPGEFYNYILANYHYHLGEHDRALTLLQESSDNLFSGLMARKLEIKIYYETDSELLFPKMDNFKLFIFRQSKKNLTKNVFQMNNAFIDVLKQIVATAGHTGRMPKIRQKLTETTLIAEREWLLEQLNRLQKR